MPAGSTYTISDPEITIPIVDYLLNPDCGLTDTLALSLTNGNPLPGVISLDAATREVKIVGADISESGVYGVTVTSTLGAQVNTDVTFQVTVNVPNSPPVLDACNCLTTTLLAHSKGVDMFPESMHVTIDEANNSTESSWFRDSVSEQCPEVDGVPLCGKPTYSLELADGGVPTFNFELVQGSQGTVEVSTWSND